MTKDQFIAYLLDKLSYAYCDNCGTEDCDMCYRKYQNWSLSPEVAKEIADVAFSEEKDRDRE